MGLLKNLIVTGASSLQGPVSFLGNERHNANSQYSASSNLYFAGEKTYFINNVGSAKFNTLTTTGSITVGTTASIAGVTTIGGNTIIGANNENKYANLTVHGNITAHDVNVNINGTSTSLKEYVSNGKDLVADAITDMGVATKTSATSTDGLPAEFSVLAENISKISPTVSSNTEISVGITSCTWNGLTNTVVAKGSASSTAYANINGHNGNTTHSDAEGTNTHTCILTHDIIGSGSWSGLTYTWGAVSDVKNGSVKLSEKTKTGDTSLSHTINGSGSWSQRGEESSTYTWGAYSALSENSNKINEVYTNTNYINLSIAYANTYSSIVDTVIQHNVGYIYISSSANVVITDGNESTEGNVPLLYKSFSGDSRLNLTHTIEGNGSWNGTTYGWSATSYVKKGNQEQTKVILSGSTTVGGDVSTEYVLEGYTFSSNIAGREVAGTMPNRSIISNAGYYFNDDGENYAANMLTSLVCKTVYNTSGESQGNHLLFSVQPGYYDPDCLVAYPLSSFGNAEQSQVLSGKKFTSSAGVNTTGTMPNRSIVSTAGYYVNNSSIAANMLNYLGFTIVYNTSGENQGNHVLFSTQAGYYKNFNEHSNCVVIYPLNKFGNVSPDNVLSGKTFTSSAGYCATGTMKELDLIYHYGYIISTPETSIGRYVFKNYSNTPSVPFSSSDTYIRDYSQTPGVTTLPTCSFNSHSILMYEYALYNNDTSHPSKAGFRFTSKGLSIESGATYIISYRLIEYYGSSSSNYPSKYVLGFSSTSKTLQSPSSNTGDYLTWEIYSEKYTNSRPYNTSSNGAYSYRSFKFTAKASGIVYPCILLLSQQKITIEGITVYKVV